MTPKRQTLSRITIKSFELTPEGALISFTICDAYCYFVGQTQLVTLTSRNIQTM